MISSMFRIIFSAVACTLAASIFFSVVFIVTHCFDGAGSGHLTAHELGLRTGYAAFVIGPVLGAVLGLNNSWNRTGAGVRKDGGSPAWGARIVALTVALSIIAPPLWQSGWLAFGAVVSFGTFGKLAALAFSGMVTSLGDS